MVILDYKGVIKYEYSIQKGEHGTTYQDGVS
ncbi:hypothetical protein LCGC14_2277830 [marine sediment metagenome]|uniref:Uncharacterized protein n=1 Tax=marine sediment metagenome TaxID=412755 RepID=A0A0F9F7F9_9ZZZZ